MSGPPARLAVIAEDGLASVAGFDGPVEALEVRTFSTPEAAAAWAPDHTAELAALLPGRPWPARDELFSMPPGDGVLVAGAAGGLGEALDAAGVSHAVAPALTAEALEAAAVVVFAPADGGAMPGAALCAMAAGRTVIAPRVDATLGLAAGSDHLAYGDPAEAARWAAAALAAGPALDPMRALGRRVAAPWRASRVYARLAADLAWRS